MGGRGSEVQILSPRPLPPDIGGSRDAASVFVSDRGGAAARSRRTRRVPRPMILHLDTFAPRLARRLPAGLAYALARLVAHGFWYAHPARRDAVLANLARVAPTRSARQRRALARKLYANFAAVLVDSWRTEAPAGAPRIVIDGDESLRAAVAAGDGVLLWSAHLGNWELAARELARRGYAIAAIARPQPTARAERRLDADRARAGVRVVARCPLAIEARRVLRRHGLLALL